MSDQELICPECGESRPDDDRVKAGMKCGACAYYCEQAEQEAREWEEFLDNNPTEDQKHFDENR